MKVFDQPEESPARILAEHVSYGCCSCASLLRCECPTVTFEKRSNCSYAQAIFLLYLVNRTECERAGSLVLSGGRFLLHTNHFGRKLFS